ncbi:hypothetical protein PVL29_010371 [Vitis rotundifolia]|uniref:fructose-bisphosphatase n=1 Tax=Vitis rotundifolia TaxID=103349 RepID=A0AA38ZTE0_VITRO|nr:hypothetical protein PVL29_010371 [Vitis rotundifolia]
MGGTIPAASSRILFPNSPSSVSRLSPHHLLSRFNNTTLGQSHTVTPGIQCAAVGSVATSPETIPDVKRKKNEFEIENLTTWLLKQEQDGIIDAELTIVLSSISLACKRIASLLQRSSISNLTGGQGTINVQGEDQKKLDVISNELDQAKQKCVVSVCQPGSNLLAAGYCLYSSSVVFTLSTGKGVFAFTLDPTFGEFVLTHADIKIPRSGKIYSFNEGNHDLWDDNLKRYLHHLRQPGPNGKPYSGRYIGCLGEIHRMLLYGGIYGNPKNKNSKKGNLRLLYECAPMSYLVEQAGGKATDGNQRILDIQPTEVHQRTPIFIGSPVEVEKLEKYLA